MTTINLLSILASASGLVTEGACPEVGAMAGVWIQEPVNLSEDISRFICIQYLSLVFSDASFEGNIWRSHTPCAIDGVLQDTPLQWGTLLTKFAFPSSVALTSMNTGWQIRKIRAVL